MKVTCINLGLWMLLILSAAVMAFGQSPATPDKLDKSVKVPQLTVEQAKNFFKAQSELNQAELNLEKTDQWKIKENKTQVFQQVIVALSQVCGTDFQLALDSNGDPVCQEKPKPATPPKK